MVKIKKRVKRRAMERQMRRMGLDLKQMDGATEVIIRFPDREYVIPNPQVYMMRAQGGSIFQVIGEPLERAPTAIPGEGEAEAPVRAETAEPFTEEDVQLVASQAGVTEEEARAALRETDGNLAQAIINLKNR